MTIYSISGLSACTQVLVHLVKCGLKQSEVKQVAGFEPVDSDVPSRQEVEFVLKFVKMSLEWEAFLTKSLSSCK